MALRLLPALLVALALFAASASALYIDPAEKCPPEAPFVECTNDPCATVRCMADTQCVVNNSCGQCSATCEPVKPELMTITGGGTAAVDDTLPTKAPADGVANDGRVYKGAGSGPKPAKNNNNATAAPGAKRGCAPGIKAAKCAYDPCIATTCLTGSVCEARYCGGCHAVCLAPKKALAVKASPVVVEPVKKSASASPAPLGRKGGSSGVMCLVDPCAVTDCGAKKKCVADYRKACTARCV